VKRKNEDQFLINQILKDKIKIKSYLKKKQMLKDFIT
jgi:hypothetical protein